MPKGFNDFPAAKKSLGQNFLIDPNIARKIVEAVPAEPGETVLEIGPGRGILTQILLAKNFRVVAVELDNFYADYLKRAFGKNPNFSLIHADFLALKLSQFSGQPIHVVGNLPYGITSPVLFKLIEERRFTRSATLMMQREVAERVVGRPRTKNYGILSIWVQTFANVRLILKVPSTVFRPRPRVESAVIHLTWKSQREQIPKNDVYFLRLIKTAFQQRRKLLRNSLKTIFPPDIQERMEFNFNRRPEEVSIDEWIHLSNKHPSTTPF
ncbi:MAG: ribosomal RNA small subunit methyltransferase A [Calditrichaeota bacterium]|nr:ribosomal RNA small subunit methyltransferase A [Calditrichota bacterium]